MILTNLVNIALKNIRKECNEVLRNKDFLHTVFLKFVAVEPATTELPFVHPRSMLINICDDSNAALRAYHRSLAAKNNTFVDIGGSEMSAQTHTFFTAAATASAGVGLAEQRRDELDVEELLDGIVTRYGRSVCEKVVHKFSMNPLFEKIAPSDGKYKTVQRFTFNYRQSAQTFKARGFVSAETVQNDMVVCVTPQVYMSAYNKHILALPTLVGSGSGSVAEASSSSKSVSHSTTRQNVKSRRHLVYLNAVIPEQRQESINMRTRIEKGGWYCSIKYLLGIPRITTLSSADCILIDQQLQQRENVLIVDLILKLRVCGFNGIVAVILRPDGTNDTKAFRNELKSSAASPDLYFEAPIKAEHIQLMTQMHEKAVIRHLLFLNAN
jgi:hypothetical protein